MKKESIRLCLVCAQYVWGDELIKNMIIYDWYNVMTDIKKGVGQ